MAGDGEGVAGVGVGDGVMGGVVGDGGAFESPGAKLAPLGDDHAADEQALGDGGREMFVLQSMQERVETAPGFTREDDDAREVAARSFGGPGARGLVGFGRHKRAVP